MVLHWNCIFKLKVDILKLCKTNYLKQKLLRPISKRKLKINLLVLKVDKILFISAMIIRCLKLRRKRSCQFFYAVWTKLPSLRLFKLVPSLIWNLKEESLSPHVAGNCKKSTSFWFQKCSLSTRAQSLVIPGIQRKQSPIVKFSGWVGFVRHMAHSINGSVSWLDGLRIGCMKSDWSIIRSVGGAHNLV